MNSALHHHPTATSTPPSLHAPSGQWHRVASRGPDESAMEAAFQRAWSCKEAYVKARGDGLGFAPLSRIHVDVVETAAEVGAAGQTGVAVAVAVADGKTAAAATAGCRGGSSCEKQQQQQQQPDGAGAGALVAKLTVDGAPQPQWRVELRRLPRGHWAAVALAPPSEAVDAFGVSFGGEAVADNSRLVPLTISLTRSHKRPHLPPPPHPF
jgi:4'-phosphopantetheinyl transferase